jgi:amidohydrolase
MPDAARLDSTIDAASEDLRALSLSIHERPELAFEERHAHATLSTFLEERGFAVERSAYGLETAFRATYGEGEPQLAILCEYDALKNIGHACGHNLIAAAGVATALALKEALDPGDGTIVVLGSPAEEGGGGKILMIEAGAFEDIDAAMMLHPTGGRPEVDGVVLTNWQAQATANFTLEYSGRAAHAAAGPWAGRNALDAVIQAFVNVGMLRQQIRPTARIHGIITEGGEATNVIPRRAAARFGVREETVVALERLLPRVRACFEAAATSTGCELELTQGERGYSELRTNQAMAACYATHAEDAGLHAVTVPTDSGGSTDMGNVSLVVPSIHPMFGIASEAGNHNEGFTAAAATPEAHARMLAAARALAHTAYELATDPTLLDDVRAEFEQAPSA